MGRAPNTQPEPDRSRRSHLPTVQPLLDGITFIDLTRVLTGPFCTMMLGDPGADVIRIEAPARGDDTRGRESPFTQIGESAYLLSANRNNRSLILSLKSRVGDCRSGHLAPSDQGTQADSERDFDPEAGLGRAPGGRQPAAISAREVDADWPRSRP